MSEFSSFKPDGVHEYFFKDATARDSVKDVWKGNGIMGAKNLLPNTAESKTEDYMTFTVNADKSIKMNGSNSTYSQLQLVIGSTKFKSGQYIISTGVPEIYNYDRNFGILIYSVSGSTKVLVDTIYYEEKTLTLSDVYTAYEFVLFVAARADINNKTIYPMVRIAIDPDDTYVPYVMTNEELMNNSSSASWSDLSGKPFTSLNTDEFTVTDGVLCESVPTIYKHVTPANVTSNVLNVGTINISSDKIFKLIVQIDRSDSSSEVEFSSITFTDINGTTISGGVCCKHGYRGGGDISNTQTITVSLYPSKQYKDYAEFIYSKYASATSNYYVWILNSNISFIESDFNNGKWGIRKYSNGSGDISALDSINIQITTGNLFLLFLDEYDYSFSNNGKHVYYITISNNQQTPVPSGIVLGSSTWSGATVSYSNSGGFPTITITSTAGLVSYRLYNIS